MVLFQVPIIGYDANGRISANVVCPFYGRYKVRLLNYHFRTTDAVARLMRLDCPQFFYNSASAMCVSGATLNSGSYGAQIFFNNYPFQGVYLSRDFYEFEADMSGSLQFDILNAQEPPNSSTIAPNFLVAYFSFDFIKI